MQNRCFACLEAMEKEGICPACGKDNSNIQNKGEEVGKVLKERYFVGELLFDDGVSSVYIGYDEQLNSKIFLRRFTGDGFADIESGPDKEELVQRFLSYCRSVATISLCDLFPRTVDIFAQEGIGYLVTEYFEGQSLKTLLASGVAISSTNALKITEKLVNGLKTMHNSRMLYGAVSPETLYILKDGGVKLFGLGSPFYDFVDDIDKRVEFLNPSYAAPELFQSDARRGSYCDTYSAAAILYRIVTNTIPPVSFLRSGGETLVKPRKINKSVPASVEIALLNALNWQIEKRTGSPERFLKELSDKNVRRRRSAAMLWAEFLGFCQRGYDKYILSKDKKAELKAATAKEDKKAPNLLWLWITLPVVLLVAIVLVLILLLPKTSAGENSSTSGESGDTWYYGSGVETPRESSDYEISSRKQSVSSRDGSVSVIKDPNLTECPDLVGYSLSQAERLLKESGLQLGEVSYEYSNDYFTDYVMTQNVPMGVTVQKGRKINLVVCKGPEPLDIDLPQVQGMEMLAAVEQIKSAGFNNIEYTFTAGSDVGTVTEVAATQNGADPLAATILVTVVGEKQIIPNYLGMTLGEALSTAPDVNITTINAEGGEVVVQEAGRNMYEVIAQSIPADTVGYKGITVQLTVRIK